MCVTIPSPSFLPPRTYQLVIMWWTLVPTIESGPCLSCLSCEPVEGVLGEPVEGVLGNKVLSGAHLAR